MRVGKKVPPKEDVDNVNSSSDEEHDDPASEIARRWRSRRLDTRYIHLPNQCTSTQDWHTQQCRLADSAEWISNPAVKSLVDTRTGENAYMFSLNALDPKAMNYLIPHFNLLPFELRDMLSTMWIELSQMAKAWDKSAFHIQGAFGIGSDECNYLEDEALIKIRRVAWELTEGRRRQRAAWGDGPKIDADGFTYWPNFFTELPSELIDNIFSRLVRAEAAWSHEETYAFVTVANRFITDAEFANVRDIHAKHESDRGGRPSDDEFTGTTSVAMSLGDEKWELILDAFRKEPEMTLPSASQLVQNRTGKMHVTRDVRSLKIQFERMMWRCDSNEHNRGDMPMKWWRPPDMGPYQVRIWEGGRATPANLHYAAIKPIMGFTQLVGMRRICKWWWKNPTCRALTGTYLPRLKPMINSALLQAVRTDADQFCKLAAEYKLHPNHLGATGIRKALENEQASAEIDARWTRRIRQGCEMSIRSGETSGWPLTSDVSFLPHLLSEFAAQEYNKVEPSSLIPHYRGRRILEAVPSAGTSNEAPKVVVQPNMVDSKGVVSLAFGMRCQGLSYMIGDMTVPLPARSGFARNCISNTSIRMRVRMLAIGLKTAKHPEGLDITSLLEAKHTILPGYAKLSELVLQRTGVCATSLKFNLNSVEVARLVRRERLRNLEMEDPSKRHVRRSHSKLHSMQTCLDARITNTTSAGRMALPTTLEDGLVVVVVEPADADNNVEALRTRTVPFLLTTRQSIRKAASAPSLPGAS